MCPAKADSSSSAEPLTGSYAVQIGSGVDAEAGGFGGKGSALARLLENGFPVPDTGIVTTTAYRTIAAASPVTNLVKRIGATQDQESSPTIEEVDGVFADVDIDSSVALAITALANEVGAGEAIAVRSSATVEDLSGSSFAGQYRSLLNIDSSDEVAVLKAVREVWSSLWHPAPTAYRRAFGVDESDVAMAVVLMRMIPATSAGVVFTLDPGGSLDKARVEAVEGLGESLVSGRTTPRAWVVPREPEPQDTEPQDTEPQDTEPQDTEPQDTLNGEKAPQPGTAENVLQSDQSELPIAPKRALHLALEIEQCFEKPQDVEWAALNDDVYIVQARPITVLETDDGFDTELDDHELTTAGIVEMVPGVLPPLRWQINRFLLEEAFRSVLDSLGAIRGEAAEDRAFVRRVRGRVAIDFDQLRAAAGGIPGAVAELEHQYFGVSDDVEEQESSAPTSRRVPRLAGLRRDLRTLATRRQVIEQADVLIRTAAALRDRKPTFEDWNDKELLAYASRLVDLAARGLAAELGVAASGAAAYSRLEMQLSSYLGTERGSSAAQSVTARSRKVVDRTIVASAAIFAGPTWLEMGIDQIPQTHDNGPDVQSRWEDLKAQLRKLPGWTRRRVLTGDVIDIRLRFVKRLTEDVIEQLHRREAAKAAILELGGEVRRVYLDLGQRFVDLGVLPEPSDIELLSLSEIRRFIGGEDGPAPDAIGRRRNWLSRYEAEGSLPVRFSGIPDREPEPLPPGDLLTGWAAGPGRKRATARVITSSTGHLEVGEVLVAESTDASWSPLFMKAGAVVVERGGPLSHAAILARELGLPAVLNVTGACRLLDGRMVSVDGDRGLVSIEPQSEKGDNR